MSGKVIDDISQTISAVSGGTLTVASTTGFYDGAYGNLYKSGQTGVNIRIIHVLSATQLTVKLVNGGQGVTAPSVIRPDTYQPYDATAYSGGTINLPAQFCYNPNDLPLT